VAELADAGGLNPPSPQGSTGSSPVPGTNKTKGFRPSVEYRLRAAQGVSAQTVLSLGYGGVMRREPVYFQKEGRWAFRVSLGNDPVTGKRQQPQRQGYRTKREAQEAAEALIREFDRNSGSVPSTNQLGPYLLDWLNTQRASLRPSTMRSYRQAVDRIAERLGAVRLADLRPLMIERFYADLLQTGLAPKTVANTHTVLRKALADADRLGMISRNAAASARPPTVPRYESEVWTAEQLREFIEFLNGHPQQPVYVLLGLTGIRRGECLGLRHRDLDLARGSLSVVQSITVVDGEIVIASPKTKRSRRQVPLDELTMGYLRAHLQRQREQRLRAGSVWSQDGDWLFTDEIGNHLHPDWLSRQFKALVRQSGLPPIRLHDLRHSYGTLSLEAGIHPKIVSERLGHATVGITLDVYSHVTESMSREAAETVSARVFGRT
jgi:integrase